MWKPFVAFACLLAPVAAQAFGQCTQTPLTGQGGLIAEEGANPVLSGKWTYAGAMDRTKVYVSAASGGAPATPVQIAKGNGPVKGLRLAAAGSSVYATWIAKTDQGPHAMFAVSRKHGAAGSWSVPLDLGASQGLLPQIAADGKNVHIAFFLLDGSVAVVNSSDGGRSFSAPVSVDLGLDEVVIASSGSHVYVAWERAVTSKRHDVIVAASGDGGASFGVQDLSEQRPASALEPIFTLDPSGNRVSLVWRENDPAQGFYLQSSDGGATWSAPLAIDTPARQFMVADSGGTIFISYLKELTVAGNPDWQVQLTSSSDGGATFPVKQNLSGPTGISEIVDDNFRPMPWVNAKSALTLTGAKADGVYVWSGKNGKLAAPVYLGQGDLASPAASTVVYLTPTGVVTFAGCK